jgi:hypothetical protein
VHLLVISVFANSMFIIVVTLLAVALQREMHMFRYRGAQVSCKEYIPGTAASGFCPTQFEIVTKQMFGNRFVFQIVHILYLKEFYVSTY